MDVTEQTTHCLGITCTDGEEDGHTLQYLVLLSCVVCAVPPVQSIKSYFANDDDFNWNYGLALAATGKYREAEDALAAVQSKRYRWAWWWVAASSAVHSGRVCLMKIRLNLGHCASASAGAGAIGGSTCGSCHSRANFWHAPCSPLVLHVAKSLAIWFPITFSCRSEVVQLGTSCLAAQV